MRVSLLKNVAQRTDARAELGAPQPGGVLSPQGNIPEVPVERAPESTSQRRKQEVAELRLYVGRGLLQQLDGLAAWKQCAVMLELARIYGVAGEWVGRVVFEYRHDPFGSV